MRIRKFNMVILSILIIVIGTSCMISGCASNKKDDFITKAIKDSKSPTELSYTWGFDHNMEYEMEFDLSAKEDYLEIIGTPQNENGEELYVNIEYKYNIKKIMLDYFADVEGFEVTSTDSENYTTIDGSEYIENVLERNGIKYSKSGNGENEMNIGWKMVDDVLYYADENGDYIATFLLLSHNDEFMKIMDECDLGDFFRDTDEMAESYVGSNYYTMLLNGVTVYGMGLQYSGAVTIELLNESGFMRGDKDILPLMEKYAGDGWEMYYSASNSVCDTLIYELYIGSSVYSSDNDFADSTKYNSENFVYNTLTVYGKDGEVKEIKYMAEQGEIPDIAKDTVKNYLMALGMTDDEAEKFIDELPEKDGKQGEVKYYVEKDSKYSDAGYVLKVSK